MSSGVYFIGPIWNLNFCPSCGPNFIAVNFQNLQHFSLMMTSPFVNIHMISDIFLRLFFLAAERIQVKSFFDESAVSDRPVVCVLVTANHVLF